MLFNPGLYITTPGVPGSKPLGGSLVDSDFHGFEVEFSS